MALPKSFILTVGIVALILWISSFLAALFIPAYKPDPIIGTAAMAVVVACYGTRKVLKKSDDEPPRPP